MKNFMLVFFGLCFFISEVRAEIISVPCEEFNKTTGEQTYCEGITGGQIKVERGEYEKFQDIYKARVLSGVRNPPPPIPKFEADESDSKGDDMGSDDCRMPPWTRKPGLKCE